MTYLVYWPPRPRPVLVTHGRESVARCARAAASASVLGVGHGRARWVHFSDGRRVGGVIENPADITAAWLARAIRVHGVAGEPARRIVVFLSGQAATTRDHGSGIH